MMKGKVKIREIKEKPGLVRFNDPLLLQKFRVLAALRNAYLSEVVVYFAKVGFEVVKKDKKERTKFKERFSAQYGSDQIPLPL